MLEHLERIAFRQEPFDGAGEGILQARFRLDRVVEGDDGTVADVFLYLGKHLRTSSATAWLFPPICTAFRTHLRWASHVFVRADADRCVLKEHGHVHRDIVYSVFSP